MERIIHNSGELAKAGPYSHAVEAAGLIFVSGMIPLDAAGRVIRDDIKAATALCLENAKKALAAANSSLDRVVKANVYLSDMANFAAMNEVYATYFAADPPARACVAVKSLPLDSPVEIELIAAR